ncbi:Hypothetical predicted protein [Mytilus galloprovincialis]|uniref:Uncharacterized protein n=1 Tax=Mytilus galloprovincialis TaxID=29158 RepID=A0A8B6GRE6_MYTGA|nr:Hypothetical predicted protein [Mytilus galloprovincialis]
MDQYTTTDVASNAEESTNLYIANTTLPDSIINLNDGGSIVNNWTCINSLNISDIANVVVFKSDASFPVGGGSRRLYLCMKLTKVTTDFFYFHLLSDTATDIFPNERVFIVEADNAPADNASVCSTFCQYTESPKIRTLRRQGSSVTLPSNVSLCEPCNSTCEEETTQITTLPSTSTEIEITTNIASTETTQITTLSSTSTDIDTSTELITTTIATTLETKSTDASCALPEDLKNTVWEYNYTDVASNLEQSTNLYIANTTLPDSVINLNDGGTIVNNWTCINSLDISDTTNVVVFKSDASLTDAGGSRRLYLCMKLTKVTPDFFYFHLLSDIASSIFPNERVFISEADNAPADNATICSTFCQYTNSPKIRTLRRQGSSVSLPSNVSLCEPCDSACKEATTMMASLETTQKHTLSSTSTEIDITTDRTSTENTQKTSKPSTSDAIDTTTYVMSTVTTQLTTLSFTSTEIDSTTEITITKTPESTLQTTSTPTEMESLTESATTAPKTTLHTTSTEMDTTLQLKSTDTAQTTAVHSTVTDLKTSTQTTIQSASTNTETTTELKVTTTDLKDETTLETKLTDTENLKRYSGPITLVGISCAGFVLVIIIFCLLKGTSMNSTEEIANNEEEKAYAASPENCYKLYKGKQFGLQEIAIRHWDYH